MKVGGMASLARQVVSSRLVSLKVKDYMDEGKSLVDLSEGLEKRCIYN